MVKPIRKTAVITGYNCNNRCRFCIYSDKKTVPDRSTNEIIDQMYYAKERGSDHLVLVGGEPFIRDDIIELISKAKKCGFKNIIAATNGRMFAYKGFAAKVIEAGLTELYFSIHGHNKKIHDSLTQAPGSFVQLMKGIDNVRSLGFSNIGSHTTIVKPNYRFLPEIGNLIFGLGIKSVDLVFVDPNYGGAYDCFDELVPKISDIIPYLKECLKLGRKRHIEHLAVRYVPVCNLDDDRAHVSDLKDIKQVHTEHIAPDFNDYYVEKTRRNSCRTKTERCFGCLYYDDCEGAWKEYIKRFGDNELKSIRSPDFLYNRLHDINLRIINKVRSKFISQLNNSRRPIIDIATGLGCLVAALSHDCKNHFFYRGR